MANFNRFSFRMKCPRCGCEADFVVDLYFGFRDQITYQKGDVYRWTSSPMVSKGGRPPEGNLDGEGYTECPECHRDFFVRVLVRNDILQGAIPDLDKKPLIPD